jgi:peptide/nickel transport system ATP-binding protein
VQALRGVSLSVHPGQVVGVVGESGSGKTTLTLSTLMLLPLEARVSGSLRVVGRELVGAADHVARRVRWRRAACVIQAPGRGLNPVRTIASQVAEPLRRHLMMGRREARDKARELGASVGLDAALLDRYPHQLSGGEQQRAMVAMALSCEPDLLVLDEPTSGLDATTKADLLATLGHLRDERDLAMLVVSHDLSAVATLADEIAVLYGGMLLERGVTSRIFADPRQPYTRDLLSAYPAMTTQKDLRGIRGTPPDPTDPPGGCPYHPRCSQAIPECATWEPTFERIAGREVVCLRGGVLTTLSVRGLRKSYPLGRHQRTPALRGVDLEVRHGEVVGVVGETGSGKSTLARLLIGLTEPDAGAVWWDGQDLASFTTADWTVFRQHTAIVFQDPFDAVSPRLSVAAVAGEPLNVQRLGSRAERASRVREALADVGLPTGDAFLGRRAHSLSGGQLQRVAVARALILGPSLLIADEPTSMLDASEQAKLMTLLKDLQVARGMALVFISHDLALVRKVADRLVVLHRGEVAESGPGHRVIAAPSHPVTRRLIHASPSLARADFERDALAGPQHAP